MRAITARIACCVLVALGATACGTAHSQNATGANTQKVKPVTIAYQPNWDAAVTVAVAKKEGFFQAAGLDPHFVRFQTGVTALSALVSGKVDFSFVGSGGAHFAMAGKSTIIAVNDMSISDYIFAAPNAGISTVKDMKGKKVLVPIGDTGQLLLALVLKRAGMTLNDVVQVNAPDPATLVSAFVSGQAPVASTYSPYSQTIKKKDPGAKVLAADANLYPEIALPDFWQTRTSTAKNDPDLVSRFLWAQEKANDWAMAHPQETTKLISQLTDVPLQTLESGAYPSGTKLLSASDMAKDYGNGTAAHWFDGIADFFVQTKTLTNVPASTSYLDFKPAIQAASHLSQDKY